MDFQSIPDLIAHPGLRIVIVRGVPSPWSQAARAIFEIKGLDYVVGAQLAGSENAELVAWSGQNSGPVVAYADEPPIHRYTDILLLAERLAPKPALLPEDPEERVWVVGLCHEVSGDEGIGWWARIAMFQPAMSDDRSRSAISPVANKWRYSEERASRASGEVVTRLQFLAAQAKANRERGSRFLVGDRLTALDIHWAAMSVLLSALPEEIMPLPPALRPMFGISSWIPKVADALDPVLIEHRDYIIERYFKTPFDYN